MFTLKANKEPTTPLKVPQKPWQDLRVYLFGPIPEKKHILVFQGQTNMFSNCKKIPSTAAQTVIIAIHIAMKTVYFENTDK